jgi:hypothetical protein
MDDKIQQLLVLLERLLLHIEQGVPPERAVLDGLHKLIEELKAPSPSESGDRAGCLNPSER